MFTGIWWKVAFLDRWRVSFVILHDCKTSRSDIEWNFSFGSKVLTCKFIAVPREYSQGVLAGKVDPSATKVVQNLELSNIRKPSFLITNIIRLFLPCPNAAFCGEAHEVYNNLNYDYNSMYFPTLGQSGERQTEDLKAVPSIRTCRKFLLLGRFFFFKVRIYTS